MIEKPLKSKGRLMRHRMLALLLTFVLVFTLCPIAAFSDADPPAGTASEPDIAVYGADGSTELELLATLTGEVCSNNESSSLEVPVYLYKCSADTESIVIHYAPHYYTDQGWALESEFCMEAAVDAFYDYNGGIILPYGLEMDLSGVDYDYANLDHYADYAAEYPNPGGSDFDPNTNNWTFPLENADEYNPIVDERNRDRTVGNNLGSYYDPTANYLCLELRKFDYIYMADGYYDYYPPIAIIYVQIGDGVPVDRSALQTAIDRADNIIATSPAGAYYYDNDRFNGKLRRGYTYDQTAREYIINSNGFYHDMLQILESSRNDIGSLSQNGIDSRAAELNAAIDKLIPTTQINATDLYGIVNGCATWWPTAGGPRIQYHDGFENYAGGSDLVVSEANTTPDTLRPYLAALEAAKTEYKRLFDYIGSDRHAAARQAISQKFAQMASWGIDTSQVMSDLDDCFNSLESPDRLKDKLRTLMNRNLTRNYVISQAEENSLLNALFDENYGAPTSYNVYSPELQASIERLVANVESARANLDKLYDSQIAGGYVDDCKLAYQGLDGLVNKIFNPRLMNEAEYTPESWAAFISARNNALTFLGTHDEPEDTIGYNAAASYMSAYQDFFEACYEGLVSSSDSVNISLSVTDNTPLRSDFGREQSDMVCTAQLEIPHDKTLGQLLSERLGTNYVNDVQRLRQILPEKWESIGIYINGVFVTTLRLNSGSGPLESRGYEDILLHNGDEVVFAIFNQPTTTSMIGVKNPDFIVNVLGDAKYMQFFSQESPVTELDVTAGESFSLTLKSAFALPMSYNLVSIAEPDAPIFISGCCATRDAALSAKITTETGISSGSDGSFSMSLYSSVSGSGWYMVAATPSSDRGGLTNGPSLLIHVTDPADLTPIRNNLKAKLREIYTAYEDEFYSESQLEEIGNYFDSGCTAIDTAQYSGGAIAAYNQAAGHIKAIQDANYRALGTTLESLENIMAHLPSIADGHARKFYQNDYQTFAALFDPDRGVYTHMTEYQKGLLRSSEKALIDEYAQIYEDVASGEYTMQDLPRPTLSFEVRDADTEELLEIGFGEGQVPILIEQGRKSFNARLNINNAGIWTLNGNDNYVYLLERPLESPLATSIQLDPAPSTGEIIVGFLDRGWARRIGRTVQTEWEVCGADCNLDEHYINDFSWTGQNEYNMGSATLDVLSPREDALLTVYVRRVNDPARSFIDAINTAYNSYHKSNYTLDNWETLLNAYTSGKIAVKAAADDTARAAAKDAALAAMAAVATKAASTEGVGSWDGTEEAFDSGRQVGTVYVSVENTTFPGGDFTGKFIEKTNYPIGENDSMMTVVLRALHDSGYTWYGTGGSNGNGLGTGDRYRDDYTITYLAGIVKGSKELAEFSGESGSGWMATLNDFFINESLAEFDVERGKLEDGDIINVLYTQNLGVDLGGTWGNSDTTLRDLEISTGILSPAFRSGEAGNSYEYALFISGDSTRVKITPHASNRNYPVRTYLNEKIKRDTLGNSYYKRSENIPVKNGDVIYVGCGEIAWPSMNNYGAEARSYVGTWYELHVVNRSNGAGYVRDIISRIPAANRITYSNYENCREAIEYAQSINNQISDKIDLSATSWQAAYNKFKYYDDIQKVKDMLSAIPSISSLTRSDKSRVAAVRSAYDALDSVQQGYITVRDVAKFNAAVDWLEAQGIDAGGHIAGGEAAAEEVKEAVVETVKVEAKVDANGVAKAKVGTDVMTKALDNVKETKADSIVIAPEVTGDAKEVKVELPKSSVSEIVKDTSASLVIETQSGSVTVPNDALKQLADQIGSANVEISVAVKSVEDANVKTALAEKIGSDVETANAAVAEITVVSGNEKITAFGGKSINASVSVDGKKGFAEGGKYLTLVISENGKKELLAGKCTLDANGKLSVGVKVGHLSTFVVLDKEIKSFADAESHWSADAVDFAIANGLMNGVSDDVFAPNQTLNRAMLVTVLYRLAGSPAASESAIAAEFDDIEAGHWYTDAVLWAASNGIVTGKSETTFAPLDNITREQFATMLMRYCSFAGIDTGKMADLGGFTDNGSISSYAKDALSWANSSGIITGRTETTIAPKGSATRGEAATMLMRFLQL